MYVRWTFNFFIWREDIIYREARTISKGEENMKIKKINLAGWARIPLITLKEGKSREILS